jgi:hypothetical protein
VEWTRAHKAWDEKGKGITSAKALAAYKAKESKKPPLSTYNNIDNQYNKLFKHYMLKCQEAGSVVKSGGWEMVRNIDK